MNGIFHGLQLNQIGKKFPEQSTSQLFEIANHGDGGN